MEYTTFGKTGVKVSRIGFGGAVAGLKNYLHSYDPAEESARRGVRAALEKAVELGITYFDTAPGYGNGQSETMFGEALEGVRDIFLATKMHAGDRDHVRRSIEASLKRLRRDSVDLVQIHGGSYTPETADSILAPGGMLETMEEIRAEGLVRWIGFTSEDNNLETYRFIRGSRFDMMQICYNFIFQHPYEPSRPFGSLYEAEKAGMGIVTMRAPTSGTFQRWMKMIRPDDTFDYTRALIQFVLSNPLVDVALIGMRTPDRVVTNVDIVNDTAGRIDIERVHTRYVE